MYNLLKTSFVQLFINLIASIYFYNKAMDSNNHDFFDFLFSISKLEAPNESFDIFKALCSIIFIATIIFITLKLVFFHLKNLITYRVIFSDISGLIITFCFILITAFISIYDTLFASMFMSFSIILQFLKNTAQMPTYLNVNLSHMLAKRKELGISKYIMYTDYSYIHLYSIINGKMFSLSLKNDNIELCTIDDFNIMHFTYNKENDTLTSVSKEN